MKIRCRDYKGDSLGDGWIKIGASRQNRYPVTEGVEYEIYAISVWIGLVQYLIIDDQLLSAWVPADLFYVHKNFPINYNWGYAYFGNSDEGTGLNMMIGYREILSEEYYISVSEDRKRATAVLMEIQKDYLL